MKKLSQTYDLEILAEEGETEIECSNEKTLSLKKGRLFLLAFFGGIILLVLILDAMEAGAKAYKSEFEAEKERTINETYSKFYNVGFTYAEKTYHTSNRVTIQLGDIREEAQLEVLKVSETAYRVKKEENKVGPLKTGDIDVWFEVLASGIFTVDLQKSEFIIDTEREYVLVRVPKPELKNFKIEKTIPLRMEENGWISAAVGEDMTREVKTEAESSIYQEILENQKTNIKAESSAENLLKSLIKGLNPQIPDLLVEVEFID